MSPYQILGKILCHALPLGCTQGWCLAWRGGSQLGSGTTEGLQAVLGGRRSAELHESVIANVELWYCGNSMNPQISYLHWPSVAHQWSKYWFLLSVAKS